jgi:DNA-binding MarR family transcriptional regulator
VRDSTTGRGGRPASPPIPETRYDLQVLRSLRRIIRAVDLYNSKLRARYDLTAPQLVCLLNIVEAGSTHPAAIARSVFVSPSTTVGILDRLEARGLVVRERDRNDRRVVNVTGTTRGRKVAREAPSPLQDSLAHGLTRLPSRAQATIARSLGKVVELMEAEFAEAAPLLDSAEVLSADLHNSVAAPAGGKPGKAARSRPGGRKSNPNR